MFVKSPKYRKSISKSQVALLELLFKFRFSSVPLLSECSKKDKSTIYERLLVLLEQGFVQKNYDSSYRLPPRPASYSLASKGIKYLRDNNSRGIYGEAALRNMYKNRSASAELINYSLDVCKIYVQFKFQYPKVFGARLKSEMSSFDDILQPLPDMYLLRMDDSPAIESEKGTNDDIDDNKPKEYLLETLDPGVEGWILRKRIRAHQTFAEKQDQKYPTLLFVCGDRGTERLVQYMVADNCLDFEIWTTTRERLESDTTQIWRDEQYEDEDVLRGL